MEPLSIPFKDIPGMKLVITISRDLSQHAFTLLNSDGTSTPVISLTNSWMTSVKKQEELRSALSDVLPKAIDDLDNKIKKIATLVLDEVNRSKKPAGPVPIKDEVVSYITDPLTIDDVVKTYNKWLYINDPNFIHILMSVAVSHKMKGEDVWMMINAPPSSGKSELIRAFGDKPNKSVYPISDFTPQALATGHEEGEDLIGKMMGKIATIKDFTTILSGREEERNKIFGILREVYDGSYKKAYGGKVTEKDFSGHTTIIAGVTNIIDMYKTFLSQLGDRFLEYRIRNDADLSSLKASETSGQEPEMRKELKLITLSFYEQTNPCEVTIPKELVHEIGKMAKFLAIMRTGVTKGYGGVMAYFPEPESPPRLTKQFTKLAKSLAIVRGRNYVAREDIDAIIRVALDTCPEMRVRILSSLIETHTGHIIGTFNQETQEYEGAKKYRAYEPHGGKKSGDIADSIKVSIHTSNYHLDDLYTLNVVDKTTDIAFGTEDILEPIKPISDKKKAGKNRKITTKPATLYKIRDVFFKEYITMCGATFEDSYELMVKEDKKESEILNS